MKNKLGTLLISVLLSNGIEAQTLAVSLIEFRPDWNGQFVGVLSANCQNGVEPYQYAWSAIEGSTPVVPPEQPFYAGGLSAGIYQVVVTDAIGNTGMATELVRPGYCAGINEINGNTPNPPPTPFPYLAGASPVLPVWVYSQVWQPTMNVVVSSSVGSSYTMPDSYSRFYRFVLAPGTMSGTINTSIDIQGPLGYFCSESDTYTIGPPTVLPNIGILFVNASGTTPTGSIGVGLTNGSIPNGIALKVRPAAAPNQWSGTQEYGSGSLPAQKIFSGLAAGSYWVVLTGETQGRTISIPNFTYTCRDSVLVTVPLSTASVGARVFLGGPYAGAGLMNDGLRTQNLIPLQEPFSGAGYQHIGGGGEMTVSSVLAVTGANAIVDWVLVELRSATQPSTRIATRSALIQRDGDVVSTNGIAPVSFNVPAGNYHVAIRHRNHLGVMTSVPVAVSSTLASINFTLPTMATYGTNAQLNVNGTMVMLSGDGNNNGTIQYTGSGNDRDPVLIAIGGSIATNTITNIYSPLDINMNGMISYTGLGNDRDVILQTIGGSVATATRVEQLP